MKRCDYCELPEIEERTIVKNKLVRAFPSYIPIVPGHTIICPIRCVAKLEELTDKELKAFLELRTRIKKALTRVFGAAGFNYAWNEGEEAGQNIPHFHLHVLPRKKGDTGITKYEPRKFLYRPGSRETTPETELQKVAAMIRDALE